MTTTPTTEESIATSTVVNEDGSNQTVTSKKTIYRTLTSSSTTSSDGFNIVSASTSVSSSASSSGVELASLGHEELLTPIEGHRAGSVTKSSVPFSPSSSSATSVSASLKTAPTATATTTKATTSKPTKGTSWIIEKKDWKDGKRPRHYRTKEGQEAAEKCKHYKSGLTVPHLSAKCDTYQGVLKHALLGALRSGGVTYGLKALVNLCLGMLKVMKGKGTFAQILKDSFVGEDAIRFGSFFGVFSFLWKLVNNGLRLYRGVDDRLNGAIAGFIAGLSLVIEGHERRVGFAQQMFMRSVQGGYNAGKHRGIWSFRHGDALLFALSCGQIMYAYTMQPQSIPPAYLNFMLSTARVPAEALAMNRMRTRGFPVDVSQVKAFVERFHGTEKAIATVSAMTEMTPLIPCAVLHPSYDSCTHLNSLRFFQVTKNIFPVYATLNFVPLVILRMKRLMVDPINVLSRTSFNTLRSSVFLAVFVVLYQSQICGHRNLTKWGIVNNNSRFIYWLFGLTCSGAAIMVEQESRRAELAMYCAPKAAESLFKIMYQRNWIKGVKHWEVAMFSAAMSVIMSFYQQEEQVLSPFVTKMIYHILGKN